MARLSAAVGLAVALSTSGCASAIQLALAPGRDATIETHRHPGGKLQVTVIQAGSSLLDLPGYGVSALAAGNLARLGLVFRSELDAAVLAGGIGAIGGVVDALILVNMRMATQPATLEIAMPGRGAPRAVALAGNHDRYGAEVTLSNAEWNAPLTFKVRDARGREIPIQRVEPLRQGR